MAQTALPTALAAQHNTDPMTTRHHTIPPCTHNTRIHHTHNPQSKQQHPPNTTHQADIDLLADNNHPTPHHNPNSPIPPQCTTHKPSKPTPPPPRTHNPSSKLTPTRPKPQADIHVDLLADNNRWMGGGTLRVNDNAGTAKVPIEVRAVRCLGGQWCFASARRAS